MRAHLRRSVCTSSLLMLLACSGSSLEQAAGETGLDLPEASSEAIEDSAQAEPRLDVPLLDWGDVSRIEAEAEVRDGTELDLGDKKGLREACVEAYECESGFCVESLAGAICSQMCTDSCPEGFSCRTVLNYYPDVVTRCVPELAPHC